MDESPGVRFRIGHTALTYAEYLRDTLATEVLFLMDNVFRFIQAGSEISSLLGRLPAAVGYQPTLDTEVAEIEDRINSTLGGAITSVQAVYVPADDMTDPAVTAVLGHLDTTVVLARSQAGKGVYPAVDPLASASKMMDRHVLGDRHYAVAEGVREHLARYRELEDVIAMLGLAELSPPGPGDRPARPQAPALSHPALPRDSGTHGNRRGLSPSGPSPGGLRGLPAGRPRRDAGGRLLHARRDDGWGERQGRDRGGGCPMRTFALHLQDATHYERLDRVESFVGRDPSGSFGLLAGHERFMTTLVFGLARFRSAGGDWEYLAVPGALVYFVDDALYLSTRRYLRDPSYERISGLLIKQLAAEEQDLAAIQESLHRLESEMLRRLWALGRGSEGLL